MLPPQRATRMLCNGKKVHKIQPSSQRSCVEMRHYGVEAGDYHDFHLAKIQFVFCGWRFQDMQENTSVCSQGKLKGCTPYNYTIFREQHAFIGLWKYLKAFMLSVIAAVCVCLYKHVYRSVCAYTPLCISTERKKCQKVSVLWVFIKRNAVWLFVWLLLNWCQWQQQPLDCITFHFDE